MVDGASRMRMLMRAVLVRGTSVDLMMVAVSIVVNLRQWIWQEFIKREKGSFAKGMVQFHGSSA